MSFYSSWQRGKIAIALLLLLPVWGCQGLNPKAETRKNQLVLATLSDPKTFNFALNQEFPNIFLFTYEGLTRQDGTTGEIVPALAESWEFSADKTQITFTLRPDLQWSDGVPLTADDVVFTYQQIIFNPEVPTDASDSLRIGEARAFPTIEKLDERRVRFQTPEPFSPFLQTTVGPPDGVAILPKHRLETYLQEKDSEGNLKFISTWGTDTPVQDIVGNGPYLLDRYDVGERVVFRRNPYYWRTDDEGRQLPYIDRIIWQIIENTDTQLLSFRSQDLDVMGDSRPLRPEYFSLLKPEEDRFDHRLFVGGPTSSTTFLAFNLNQGLNLKGQPLVDPVKSQWFRDRRFRQAIAHAINRPKMLNNLFQGMGVIQNSPISVQSPFFQDQDLKIYEYDLNRSKQLLKEAGFRYNAQGQLQDADGNVVEFNLLTNSGNKIREAIGAQIREDLSKIGVKANFAPIAFSTLVSKLTATRDWETHIIGFTGGIEPHNGANLWTSEGGSHLFNLGQQPGQPDLKGWQRSPWENKIDQLFVQGAQSFDDSQRQQIYSEFQQIVQDEVPMIYLVNELSLMAARDRVKGIQYSGLPTWGLWNIAELKVIDE